ncbi:MAG TPA: MBL fold metallo-hydrolase, partial [Gemmatimonadales bacterium]|nr:MBL fold metallo-hydrolase [Gemmatimonadales bacterium]
MSGRVGASWFPRADSPLSARSRPKGLALPGCGVVASPLGPDRPESGLQAAGTTRTSALRLALLVLVALFPAIARAQGGTKVVLLGTGFPRPDPNAWGPATAVVVGDRVFLVDAGVGVERRMAAAHLPINGPTALFITHLHSDHTLGLADLILTSWVMQRPGPLHAFGPPGLQPMVDHLMAAYSIDLKVRTEGLEHETLDKSRVIVQEIQPGVIYDSAGVKVTAFRVDHGPLTAFGYRFDTPGRVVVISGDTRPSEELVKASQGADVLVHEVYAGSHLKVE